MNENSDINLQYRSLNISAHNNRVAWNSADVNLTVAYPEILWMAPLKLWGSMLNLAQGSAPWAKPHEVGEF